MDNKLCLLIYFTIYLMLFWLPFSRMLRTEKSQDLARDQVWTDPGQQPLCKVPVIISCLVLFICFLIWLIAWWSCCSALTKKLRERILEFQVPPFNFKFQFLCIIYMVNMFSACLSTRNGAKIYSQIVRSVILGCRTLSLTKLEKDLKNVSLCSSKIINVCFKWACNFTTLYVHVPDITRRNPEGISWCSGASCFHWSSF